MNEHNLKSFGISNPEGSNDVYAELLIRLSSNLEKLWPVYIHGVIFENELNGSRGYPTPTATIYYFDDEDSLAVAQNLDGKEWAKEERIASKLPTREYEAGSINRLTLRLPQGEQQDNLPELLRYVASEIKDIPNENILEIIFKSFIDNDSVDHPFILVYFRL